MLPGYAPFCVLHVHRDWTSTSCLTVPVTDANRHLLRSDYEAREPAEIPMAPITMMRNALGVAEGGSGVALDPDAYRRSVAFWSANANWR